MSCGNGVSACGVAKTAAEATAAKAATAIDKAYLVATYGVGEDNGGVKGQACNGEGSGAAAKLKKANEYQLRRQAPGGGNLMNDDVRRMTYVMEGVNSGRRLVEFTDHYILGHGAILPIRADEGFWWKEGRRRLKERRPAAMKEEAGRRKPPMAATSHSSTL